MKWAAILGLLTLAASAQTIQVYSEFARLSDTGDPVTPATPREILSPAVPRNAFTTFQLAIQAPPGTKYHVFVSQNPANALKAAVYRKGKPEAVGLPYEGAGSEVLWMDLWADAAAPVRRVKVEPQVFINNDWVSYPMEVRVSELILPGLTGREEPVLCGAAEKGREPFRERNARQDAALLAHATPAQVEAAKAALDGCGAKTPSDPEFYLRLRDLFVSPAWQKMR